MKCPMGFDHAPSRTTDLDFADDGAVLFRGALGRDRVHALERALAGLPPDQAGIRLHGIGALVPFLSAKGPVGRLAVSVLGNKCHPVRAILFDKSATTNWSLPWHQDRTIAVKQRREVCGFGPWSIKSGMLHVEPPFAVLAGMATLRVHIDAVSATNAPLLIAPGSHRLGRIPENKIPEVVKRCGIVPCQAQIGDIWVYATPILHASAAAAEPSRRRVLQVDFAACPLPGGLEWLGV